ncbi:CHAT domain-containing protein [Catenuloplanes japonicus]|uniref:CHAT domain-containing protein n=1 Tax=Catenuloplanes japonicus TaxID=33876 RepID=UPI0005256A97|nr:CHAT domain-containing protein [Catenuloplanes japonicus]
MRDQWLDALHSAIRRAADGDAGAVTGPAVAEAAASLAATVGDPAADLEASYALGLFHHHHGTAILAAHGDIGPDVDATVRYLTPVEAVDRDRVPAEVLVLVDLNVIMGLMHDPDRLGGDPGSAGTWYVYHRKTGSIPALEHAHTLYRRDFDSLADDSPERPFGAGRVAEILRELYDLTGEEHHLAEAESAAWWAYARVDSADVRAPGVHAALAQILCRRYERTGDLTQLDGALTVLAAAAPAEGTPPEIAAVLLGATGLAHGLRFEVHGDHATLTAQLDALRRAVAVCATDDPLRPIYVNNLGNACVNAYKATGDAALLAEAIGYYRKDLEGQPPDGPTAVLLVSNLGAALINEYDRTQNLETLHELITIMERASRNTSVLAPYGRTRLGLLGIACVLVFHRTGDRGLLDRATDACRRAVTGGLSADPHHLMRVANLAVVLIVTHQTNPKIKIQTERGYASAPLDEAITVLGEALRDRAASQYRADALNALGIAYATRWQHDARREDLEAAVELKRQAVTEGQADSPYGTIRRAGLATSLIWLGLARDDRHLLDEAITIASDAAAQTRAPLATRLHATRQWLSAALHANDARQAASAPGPSAGEAGQAMSETGQAVNETSRASTETSQATGETGQAVNETNRAAIGTRQTTGHTGQAASQTGQATGDATGQATGDATGQAASQTGQAAGEAAGQALSQTGQAAGGATGQAAHGTGSAGNETERAVHKIRRGGGEAGPAGNEAARATNETGRAVDATGPATDDAGRAGDATGPATDDAARAVDAAEFAVALLPQVTGPQLARADREYEVDRLTGLSADVAAAALAAHRPERAAELLEASRSLLATESIDARGDLPRLREHDRALADRFETLRDLHAEVDARSAGRQGLRTGEGSPAAIRAQAAERARIGTELGATLTRIRTVPGFAGFLGPPRVDELTAQAGHGAVVLLSTSPHRSDAIVLRAGAAPLVVPLPALTPDDADRHAATTANIHPSRPATTVHADRRTADRQTADRQTTDRHSADHHSTRNDSADHRTTDMENVEDPLAETLSWLWETITGPVLEALGHDREPADGPWPRVWWCPAGVLSRLPLHAAGTSSVNAMDHVISSYTPTVRALAHARRSRPVPTGSLIVSVPEAPGTAPLHRVTREAQIVRDLLPGARTLHADDATRPRVLAALPRSGVVHFACHGVAGQPDPGEGALMLHDNRTARLTVRDLLRLRLTGAGLAFLSACDTGRGGEELQDESVHLAGAAHLAGFRHVVGTLWPISDDAAQRVTRSFYRALTDHGRRAARTEDTAIALHGALRAERLRHPSVPRKWAAHISVGP